jgi:hypothetical protein
MKKILLFALFFSMGLIAVSQSDSPINSNYLIEHGVSPRILDAAASGFMQDGRFIQKTEIIITSEGVAKSYDIDLIYDPTYEKGMDIRLINNKGTLNRKELKILKKYIEKSHYFSRMSEDYLYDESTLRVHERKGDTLVLEYFYQKKNLDPYLKYIKKIKGFIYFVDGKLDKVVLKNVKPLKGGVKKYKKEVVFAKVEGRGGYIIQNITESMIKEKRGKPSKVVIRKKTLDYTDEKGDEVAWKGKEGDYSRLYNTSEAVNVKLGGPLPLLGKEATKMGYKLPRPYGVAGFVYAHSQLLQITALKVGFDGSDLYDLQGLFDLEKSSVTQSTFMTMAKADVWLFPFLNVMAIVGGGNNDLDGELVISEDLHEFMDKVDDIFDNFPNLPDIPNLPKSIPVKMGVSSEIYGGGLTFAGAVGNFNLLINYQLMFTKMVEANTVNMVNIVTPTLGYMLPFGVNIMAGAQGQFYNTALRGYFDLTDNNGGLHRLDYQIDFEPIQWNGIVGVYKNFYEHWEMSFQVGFGQRTLITAVFGYRF